MQTCQASLCQLYTLFAAFFPAAQSLPWLVAASELSSELCAGRAGAGGMLWCCCTHHWALGKGRFFSGTAAEFDCWSLFCHTWMGVSLCVSWEWGIAVTGVFEREIRGVLDFTLDSLLGWQCAWPKISSSPGRNDPCSHITISPLQNLSHLAVTCSTTDLLLIKTDDSGPWMLKVTSLKDSLLEQVPDFFIFSLCLLLLWPFLNRKRAHLIWPCHLTFMMMTSNFPYSFGINVGKVCTQKCYKIRVCI